MSTPLFDKTYFLTHIDCYDSFGEPLREEVEPMDLPINCKVNVTVSEHEGQIIFTSSYPYYDIYDNIGEPMRDDIERLIVDKDVSIRVVICV
jgi:hypothetical protein